MRTAAAAADAEPMSAALAEAEAEAAEAAAAAAEAAYKAALQVHPMFSNDVKGRSPQLTCPLDSAVTPIQILIT